MFKKLLAAVALVILPFAAMASDYGTEQEAIAMVERAHAKFTADGIENLIAAVADKGNADFHDRDLYVMVADDTGTVLGHGANAGLVGRNILGLKDQNGTEFVKEMIETAQANGSGWVSYLWSNPQTKVLEKKKTWIVALNETQFIGVGIYGE